MKSPRKLLLTCVLLCASLAACDARQEAEYQGGLYFGQGPYLMRYSLSNGSLSVVGHLGDTIIREISPLRGTHLLIAESAWANERRVPRISWFSLETGESVDLYAGLHARYLPAGNVIVYDDGSDLYAVPQRPESENFVIFSHEKNQLNQLLRASAGLLLFEVVTDGQPMIHAWQAPGGEVRRLEQLTSSCRLIGAVWVASLERLACKRREGSLAAARYVLAGVEGKVDRVLPLPEDRQFRALAYIESLDALVLRETWRGMLGKQDQHSVWVHEFESGETHRLPGDVNLGISAVYTNY